MAPQAVSTLPDSNPLNQAVREAGLKLLALQMPDLVGVPDSKDAGDMVDSLEVVADIVDDALLSIGRELRSFFGHDIDLSLFTNQLLGALDGNAFSVIPRAARSVAADYEADRYPYHEAAE